MREITACDDVDVQAVIVIVIVNVTDSVSVRSFTRLADQSVLHGAVIKLLAAFWSSSRGGRWREVVATEKASASN